MPTVLRNFQHEILSDFPAYGAPGVPARSLLFGTTDTKYLTTNYPVIEGDEGTVGDIQRFRDDGVTFGEDFDGSKKVTFEIGVLADTPGARHLEGSDLLDVFESVWRDRRYRRDASAYAVLRSQQVPGRTRRAYGRPRRYSEQAGPTTTRGMTPIICDFVTSDGQWYDDVAQSVTSSLSRSDVDGVLEASVKNAAGQWVFRTLPGTSTVEGYIPTKKIAVQPKETLLVGGSKPTWPVVTFHAGASGVLNPSVSISGLLIELADTIAPGESVTVDPRPWVRRLTRSDGASKGGRLSPRTQPLRNLMLYPGEYTLDHQGLDPTGTSWAEVSWRNAWSRW